MPKVIQWEMWGDKIWQGWFSINEENYKDVVFNHSIHLKWSFYKKVDGSQICYLDYDYHNFKEESKATYYYRAIESLIERGFILSTLAEKQYTYWKGLYLQEREAKEERERKRKETILKEEELRSKKSISLGTCFCTICDSYVAKSFCKSNCKFFSMELNFCGK